MPEYRTVLKAKHFDVQEIAEGVFAAIHHAGGWAIGNAGFVDMGDFTLVFDTMLTVPAAAELRQAAEQLTGKAVKMIVNSHYHNDHTWGNQAFDPETQIISSIETRQLFLTKGQEEFDWYKENSTIELSKLQAQYDKAAGKEEREGLVNWIEYYQGLVESLPILSIRLPNVAFADCMEIYGNKRSVKLMSFKGGHTDIDSILYLPAEDIVFMADLLFVESFPFLIEGDPSNLVSTLDKINELNAAILIPGHGSVGTPGDVELVKDYVKYCGELGERIVKGGQPAEAIDELEIRPPFSSWKFPSFHKMNLRYFAERYKMDLS